ncbi:MAG: hypothetical protein B6D73_13810 [gamma proteobacterium symbiont of Stewartia floridana]|nr:MAG: hypothetical protein B6D73_13810 [gamma proteobacterium symbiont of Stewartia floridana]
MKTFGGIVLLMLSISVHAFEINVHSSYLVSEKKFEEKWPTSPVHENLLAEVMNQSLDTNFSVIEKAQLIQEIAIGTRWNDDPLDLIRKKKKDALFSFLDSCQEEKSKSIDATWDLMYRTHCGDMQFLHSMASNNDEIANVTKRKILAWTEFSYKVAVGVIPTRWRFRSIDRKMSDEGARLFKAIMISKTGGRSKWTPYVLFSQSCDRDFTFFSNGQLTKLKCAQKDMSERQIENMALGSLIHVIQDSFSKSHTERKDGDIIRFGIYSEQSSHDHKKEDKHYDDTDSNYSQPNLYAVLSEIIRLALEDRNTRTDENWTQVRGLLTNTVFKLRDGGAHPGNIGY